MHQPNHETRPSSSCVLLSAGLGNRRENIISFQQFPGPRAVPDADIEPGFVAPYVIDKPSVAKKSKRRENPLPMFMNGVCNETVPVPSQKRKRVNGKAVGNDGKDNNNMQTASKLYLCFPLEYEVV
jgi:hypothetical protein